MVNKVQRLLAKALAVVLWLPFLMMPTATHAAAATLSLSPASGSLTAGQNLIITVKVNSGSDPINAVQANLSYPTAQFDSASVSSSAAFDISAQTVASGGVIEIGRGASTPVTGAQDVATITLHSKATGSAAISFTSGSAVASSSTNTNILTGSTGGNYTINAASSTPPPASVSGGTSGSSSSSTGSKSSPKTTTPSKPVATGVTPASAPVITNLKATNSNNQITVSWTTDKASSSVVDYGLTTSYGLNATTPGLVTAHTVKLNPGFVQFGSKYQIKVTSADASGSAATATTNLQLAGYSVTIHVTDKQGKALKGVKVSLAGAAKVSDGKGVASFDNVSYGQQTVKLDSHGKTSESKINVGKKDDKTPVAQEFTLVAATSSNQWPAWLWLVGALVVTLAAVGIWLLVRKKPGDAPPAGPAPSAPSVPPVPAAPEPTAPEAPPAAPSGFKSFTPEKVDNTPPATVNSSTPKADPNKFDLSMHDTPPPPMPGSIVHPEPKPEEPKTD